MRRAALRFAAGLAAAALALAAGTASVRAYPTWGAPPYPDAPYFCPNQSPMDYTTVVTNDPTVAGNPEQNTFWGWHPDPGYDDWYGHWYGDFRGTFDDDSGWVHLFRIPYGQQGYWNFSSFGWGVHGHVTQWIAYYNPTFGGQCGYGAYGAPAAPPYMADVIGWPVVDIYVDAVPPYPAQPRLTAVTTTSVSFTWDPVADRGDGGGQGYFAVGMGSYTSWLTVNGGAPQQRATTTSPRTLTASGLTSADQVCMHVVAADLLGNAAPEGVRCATPIPPPPMPAIAPPPGTVHANPAAPGLVGFPSWFWLDPQPQPDTVTESSGGYTYQVTAAPVATTWTFGDGGQLTLDGAAGYGYAYPAQSSVAWTYEAQSAGYAVSAVETYDVTWTVESGGTTYGPYPLGSLAGPPATLAYPVQQAQPELTG